jgi:hypothetical protein
MKFMSRFYRFELDWKSKKVFESILDGSEPAQEKHSLKENTHLYLITNCLNAKVHCEAPIYRRRGATMSAIHEDKW